MSELERLVGKTRATIKTLPVEKQASVVDLILGLFDRVSSNMKVIEPIAESYGSGVHTALVNQVDAAEKRTLHAADSILSSADAIMGLLAKVPDPAKQGIQSEINKIFEACSFQDLVAQHLNEVKLLVEDVSIDMEHITLCVKSIQDGQDPPKEGRQKHKNRRSDAHLLNGPSTQF